MNSIRVVLVEDSAIFCFLFKKFLEDYPSKDIEVQVFSDGQKAFDHFTSIKNCPNQFPDLIFLDLNMPYMNGWDLLCNLVDQKIDFIHTTPVYIVSSSKSSTDRGKCVEYLFIKDYITKPIDRETIYSVLDEYFSN